MKQSSTFVSVSPVFEGNRIVAVAAVAKKDADYDATDVRQHTLLLDGMWKLIQRERALIALLESESLAAMGRALSSVAHDMKTPLIAIGGFTRLAQKHMEETNPHRQKLDIVIKETQRLEAMVKDMLDFSRPLDIDRSTEEVENIISESLILLDSMAKEREVSLRSAAWRAPLRAALDWLRDGVNTAYERLAGRYLTDPWAARDDYIDVIVDRSPDRIDAFLNRHAIGPLKPEDEITVWKLMELQRHAMLMYTSCGWFFDDLSGIETVQVIQYAGRVLQLADRLFPEDFETAFLERLELAKSNLPEQGDGRRIYEKFVRPAMLDLKHVVAHYAISSLFEECCEPKTIYSYAADREDYRSFQVGNTKLVIGRATVTSQVTRETTSLCFGVLHLGDHNIACGTGEYEGAQKYEDLVGVISEAFAGADFPKTILLLGRYFGTSTYSLTSLFADERRRVLNLIMEPALLEGEAAYGSIYEHHAPLIRFLKGTGTPRPKSLSVATDFSLNAKLRRALQGEWVDSRVIPPLLEEARLAGAALDAAALGLLVAAKIERLAEKILAQPDDISLLQRLNEAAKLVRTLPFEVNLWKTQNICYKILHTCCPDFKEKAEMGDRNAREWMSHCAVLAENLSIRVP